MQPAHRMTAMAGQSFIIFVFLVCIHLFNLQASTSAQTGLDDVHISSRGPSARPAIGAGGLAAGLHLIKKDVNLVLVPVSVVDPLQRLVVGLHSDNFQVFEGKKVQPISHFSSEDAPVSIGIIVDSSGSMVDKMERVRAAVNEFCEAANLQDEFFMMTFSDKPRMATEFTRQPADLENQLLFTQPKGRTALLDAIHMGLGKMKEAQYAKKALLVISDGGDNHSRFSEKDIRAAVKESDVMIYAIGTFDRYVPTQEEQMGPSLLSSITEPTGGRAFTITDARDLPEVSRMIAVELRTQYVLGYQPEDVAHDGKWHKVSVKLRLPKGLPFLRVRAKSGYYAQPPAD